MGIFFSANGGMTFSFKDYDDEGAGIAIANGVLIFLSVTTIIVQIVVIVDLFKRFKWLRIKIPSGKTLWYLSSIIVGCLKNL